MRLPMQHASEVAAGQAQGVIDPARMDPQSAQIFAQQQRDAAQQQREAAQQQRDAAQQQREAAQQQRDAANEQRQAAREQARAGQDGTPVVITITKDGKTVTIDNASPEAAATALGIPLPDRQRESDGPYVVGGLAIVSTAFVVLASVVMWYRTRMRGSSPAALPADLVQRLNRMEVGIESVAVEVERISEGQRFTTRLLSDRDRVEVPRG